MVPVPPGDASVAAAKSPAAPEPVLPALIRCVPAVKTMLSEPTVTPAAIMLPLVVPVTAMEPLVPSPDDAAVTGVPTPPAAAKLSDPPCVDDGDVPVHVTETVTDPLSGSLIHQPWM